ncbi:MAG: hypothetical protein QF475_03090 [Candidatus Undinarchaeales archaeon]|jgi:hypothetical protein|nr:hypothetical protein [Candidatus Undinarchaeales archaeon]
MFWNIDWGDISRNHKIIGFTGLGLLLFYFVLSIFWGGFRGIFFRGLFMFVSFIVKPSMIIVLVPIYINWITSDFFQERKGTSFVNALTNGVAGSWICVEWIRMSVKVNSADPNFLLLIGKIMLSLLVLLYAALVIKDAWKGEGVVRFIGRAREMGYISIMMTPIIYNAVPLSFSTLVAVILMFPVFYGVIDFLEFAVIPTPKFMKKKL